MTKYPNKVIPLLYGIWRHLSKRRQFQLSSLVAIMLLSGIAELFSLGAIIPFLTALSDPQSVTQIPLVHYLIHSIEPIPDNTIIITSICLFIVVSLVSTCIRLSNLWLNGKFSAALGSDLSCKAYKLEISQPYSNHLSKNTANIVSSVATHIPRTVYSVGLFFQLLTDRHWLEMLLTRF